MRHRSYAALSSLTKLSPIAAICQTTICHAHKSAKPFTPLNTTLYKKKFKQKCGNNIKTFSFTRKLSGANDDKEAIDLRKMIVIVIAGGSSKSNFFGVICSNLHNLRHRWLIG